MKVGVETRKAKAAVTVVSAVRVTVQLAVPAQPPPCQPVKTEPGAGVGVSVTRLPLVYLQQLVRQVLPAGLLATVPLPVPAETTVRAKICRSKVAVTVVSAVRVTVQLAVPVQPPPCQPVKTEPGAGVGVSVTRLPLVYLQQLVRQVLPAGLLATVPLPVPAETTVRAKICRSKVAVTVVSAVRVTVQLAVPVQPPPCQPVKTEPGAGVGVSVTRLPLVYLQQLVRQVLPAGLLATVPLPVPAETTVRAKICRSKVAVTVVSAVRVTVQLAVPVQPPPCQPVKTEPGAGVGVSVTRLPLVYLQQLVRQVLPAGLLATVPLPVPAETTVRAKICRSKVAVTVVSAVRVTVQLAVPVQPPPCQPVKTEPGAGVGVSVTRLPLVYLQQLVRQVLPAGLLATVPLPVPAETTVRAKICRSKVAVTVVSAVRVTVQLAVPVQPPPCQPVKTEPGAGVGVSVTRLPLVYLQQLVPQVLPAGLLATVPLPVPAETTVRAKICRSKVAVTVVSAVRVTVQLAVPVQPPPCQPVKTEPGAGVGVSVTRLPLVYLQQLVPQVLPAGLL